MHKSHTQTYTYRVSLKRGTLLILNNLKRVNDRNVPFDASLLETKYFFLNMWFPN